MVTKNERISNTLKKKPLEKTKTLMNFDSNVNKDRMKEGKVAKTVVRIECYHTHEKNYSEIFVCVDFNLYYTDPDSPHGGLSRVGVYLSESSSEMVTNLRGAYQKSRLDRVSIVHVANYY